MNEALKEVQALASLHNEGLVRYNHSWIERPPPGWQKDSDAAVLKKMDEKYKESQIDYASNSYFLYIQMELCPQSLADWLKADETRDLYQAKVWFKQIVSAIAYLHSKKKIHRDLKPNNVLIDAGGRAKICDLGLIANQATHKGEEIGGEKTEGAGTELYMPLEQKKPSYTSKVDIFSLGLILTEQCVQMNSVTRNSVFNNYRKGRPNTVLKHLPLMDRFISWLTNVDPSKRPTCDEILKDPFLL